MLSTSMPQPSQYGPWQEKYMQKNGFTRSQEALLAALSRGVAR
jgi:hypothetical protein